MLSLSAHSMGAIPCVLSEKATDPAQQVVSENFLGDLKDLDTLKAFIQHVDVLTFESEFIDCDLLEKAAGRNTKKIHPSIAAARLLQDRKTQKELLDVAKIPTAPWLLVHDAKAVADAADYLSYPFVLKKRRNGYDGYGTYIFKTKKDLEKWNTKDLSDPHGFIAEKFIPFKRELACIFTRDQKGHVLQFPLVESLQKDARCYWIKGPIQHPQFLTWSKKFSQLLKKINYVGTMGVELFESKDQLIVNELAPRVHNTGHYSSNSLPMSQFDAHLRAVSGMSLPNGSFSHEGFAMVNLLGSEKAPKPQWISPTDAVVHWYGKTENRTGRKMGHINAIGSSPNVALKRAMSALKGFKL
jgi:phosphoribosylaminoimidazole carboxylase PurK protein